MVIFKEKISKQIKKKIKIRNSTCLVGFWNEETDAQHKWLDIVNSLPSSQGLFQNNKAALMNVFSQTDGGLMLTFPGNCSFSQNPPQTCISPQGHSGYLLRAWKGSILSFLWTPLSRLFSRSRTVNEEKKMQCVGVCVFALKVIWRLWRANYK